MFLESFLSARARCMNYRALYRCAETICGLAHFESAVWRILLHKNHRFGWEVGSIVFVISTPSLQGRRRGKSGGEAKVILIEAKFIIE